jgi:MFS family permease
MQSTRRALYVSTWLNDTALILLMFVLSRYLAETSAGLLNMGIFGGSAAAAWAVTAVITGALSDRIGRKCLLMVAVFLSMASAVGCAVWLENRAALLAAYALSGVAGAMYYAPLIAWLGEGESGIAAGRRRATRTLMFFCFAWNLGIITGQIFGGYTFQIDPRLPLYLAMALPLANLVLLWRMDGRPVVAGSTGGCEWTDDAERRLSAHFARISWVGNLGAPFCVGILFYLLPDLMVFMGVPAEEHGLLLALMRVLMLAAYMLMHVSSFWHHRIGVLLVMRALGVVGMLVIGAASTRGVLFAGMCAVGVMMGFNYFATLYYSTAGSREGRRGRASGMLEGSIALGMAMGTFGGGLAGCFHPRAPYLLAAVVVALLVVVEMTMYRRLVTRESGTGGRVSS